MSIFLVLFLKVLPLYFLILLGFVARRFLQIEARALSRTVIFLIAPVIIFHSGFTAPLAPSVLALPFLFWGVACVTALTITLLARFFYKGESRSLLSCAAGNSNTGYFGLPVILAVLGQDALTVGILTSLGSILYENSLGVFLLARGHYSARESLKKIVRLPALYAFGLGLALNALGLHVSAVAYTDFIALFKGAYVVLGMMIIGCGIGALQKSSLDLRLTVWAFFGKFLVFPLFMFGLLFADAHMGQILSEEARHILWILSLAPVAANTVAYATEFKVFPEKAAVLVFLSTVFALVFIPFAYPLLG